jgi:phosphotriesterase-related protein
MTVNGLIDADQMGFTLVHEHLFADLRSYEEQSRHIVNVDIDDVLEVVLPHLQVIRKLGCRTFIDCTATHIGRHPALIKRLSEASGLHMLTVTGNYLSADERFVPPYVRSASAEGLARRWTDEWRNGIADTGIRPGLIKLGMNGGPLSELEKKAFEAAALTHQSTGLPIAVHIGPWRPVDRGFNAASAAEQLEILRHSNILPSAWVWVHAQNETDRSHHVLAAQQGAWISFDGLAPHAIDLHIECVTHMKSAGLLHRVLVSHDAGWYNADQPRGGTFRPYDTAFTTFIPALRERGFTQGDINQIFVTNPAEAFSIRSSNSALSAVHGGSDCQGLPKSKRRAWRSETRFLRA